MGASDSLEQRKEAKRRWIDPREDGACERGRENREVRDGTGAEAEAAKEQAPRRRAFWGDGGKGESEEVQRRGRGERHERRPGETRNAKRET